MRQHSPHGYSLVELLLTLGLFAAVGGLAIPQLLANLDEYRAASARYVALRIQRTRTEAVSRSTSAAMQFVEEPNGYRYGYYMDGDGDGIRTPDIKSAVDFRIGAPERLSDHFAGVDFGVLPGIPPIDGDTPAPGADPIGLGQSNLLSFSPAGTSTSGSLYIRGRGQCQYAVRVFGDTGRTRIVRLNPRRWRWESL